MGKYPVSPLAPESFPELPVIGGVRFAAVEAGVRYQGRLDVMLAHLAPGSVVTGVFTRSATRSAPVRDCEAKLRKGSEAGAAILVNSGNSNAFTGGAGQESVDAICAAVAEAADVPKNRVFTASTGVIGERLPHDRITAKVGELVEALDEGGIGMAAKAIMTTDTFPKGAAREVTLKGGTVKVAGIAKGSGMIAPDMATMLVYIFTDAKLSRDVLQGMVSGINETTFNAITVDGDTSTSDTLICAATGASGVDCDSSEEFEQALKEVMRDLAHQVVRDGEGATKFVTVKVTGAAHDADAKRVAMSIANSPLVKTAIAGEDPNWGRIVMAVGKSGAEADRDKLKISFGEVLVAENGWVAPGYSEDQGAGYMKLPELVIKVDLGLARGRFTAWTCDLTHQYITINADYRS